METIAQENKSTTLTPSVYIDGAAKYRWDLIREPKTLIVTLKTFINDEIEPGLINEILVHHDNLNDFFQTLHTKTMRTAFIKLIDSDDFTFYLYAPTQKISHCRPLGDDEQLGMKTQFIFAPHLTENK